MGARMGAEFLAGLRDSREVWLDAERVVAYYEWFRERDLCATHTFGTFRANRVRGEAQQDDPTVPLHIVGESAEGLVVSGARNMATLGPFADEMLVFPAPMRMQGGDADR